MWIPCRPYVPDYDVLQDERHIPKESSPVDPYGAEIAPPQVKPEPAVQA